MSYHIGDFVKCPDGKRAVIIGVIDAIPSDDVMVRHIDRDGVVIGTDYISYAADQLAPTKVKLGRHKFEKSGDAECFRYMMQTVASIVMT